MNTAIGGTFDLLHKGHRFFLREAVKVAGKDMLVVGITSDEFALKLRDEVNPFEERKKRVEEFLKSLGANFTIVRLDDPYGPAIELEELEAIVVSEETFSRALEINKIREKRGLRPLKIHKIPIVTGEDYKKISCRKIREGLIDSEGKLLRALRIGVATKNRGKLKAVEEIMDLFYPKIEVFMVKTQPEVPAQPFDAQVIEGAVQRARKALESGADIGVGIEGGLLAQKYTISGYLNFSFCAIVDRDGLLTIGASSGFEWPKSFVLRAKNGEEMAKLMEELTGDRNVRYELGGIGFFSKGKVNRVEYMKQAVLAAMIPRINPGLYGTW